MLFDTHCHLNMKVCRNGGQYDVENSADADIGEVILRAKHAGISNIMQAGTFVDEIDREIEICKNFSDNDINIYCAIANHPENIKETGVISADELVKVATKSDCIKAIGETGLDTHKENNLSFFVEQKKSFENHIDASIQTKLPIIVHAYGLEAIEKSIDIVCTICKTSPFTFVFHCYDGTYEQAKQIVDCGGFISFSGTATFKKKTIVKDILTKIPLDFVVIETDAPFLAPTPLRGQPNEPSYIKYTAEFISNFLQMDYDKFCNITSENGKRLFSC